MSSGENLTELKQELKEAGWSQRQMALECGVKQPHVNQVLNGKRESVRLEQKLRALAKRRPKRRALAK
jgi:transcriptional regulator with XRE-family HTH domain